MCGALQARSQSNTGEKGEVKKNCTDLVGNTLEAVDMFDTGLNCYLEC